MVMLEFKDLALNPAPKFLTALLYFPRLKKKKEYFYMF